MAADEKPQRELAIPSMGQDALDRQHRVMLRRYRLLEEGLAAGQSDTVRASLWFLEVYVEEHFLAEERLMTRIRYPDAGPHLERHARFLTSLKALRAAADRGLVDLSSPEHRALVEWFERQEWADDRGLAAFLAQHGGDTNGA